MKQHQTLLAIATVMALLTAGAAQAGSGIVSEMKDDPDRAAGDLFQILNPLVAAGFTLYKGDYQGTKQYAYDFAATFAATEALKYTFNNTSWGERPNGHDGSFPSGHTSAACSAAAFISDRYGWQYGLPLYATAAFTAYSRSRSYADRCRFPLSSMTRVAMMPDKSKRSEPPSSARPAAR